MRPIIRRVYLNASALNKRLIGSTQILLLYGCLVELLRDVVNERAALVVLRHGLA